MTSLPAEKNRYTAIFSGGCFWCLVEPFERLNGVLDVIAGYSGGTTENPDYGMVSSGRTDHLESVRITYDADVISYQELVEVFWRQIDPTDDGGQFADRGSHYKTAIFFTNEEQKNIAQQSKKDLQDSGLFSQPVVTPVLPATKFYPAEEYHQKYYQKNFLHYSAYKKGSGRAAFLRKTWEEK